MPTMKPFSLLVKPASADCNMRCDYCFYLDRCSLYPRTSKHRMSGSVLEAMIRSYMETYQPQYTFSWQGGEPTLMGVDFFRRVVELQKKYGCPGSIVANGLQTNATMIDKEFAHHLSNYRFLVGVSLDGPPRIHDHYRHFVSGRGSHADVMRGIGCLQQNRVEFNILTLVSNINVGKGRDIYHYLRDKGFIHQQYIPCVEFDNNGQPLAFTISATEWGDFLCEVFDGWMKWDTRRVSIRLFDAIISYLVDGRYTACQMEQNCCQYFLIEHNGDVYPCDFFVRRKLKLGNILDTSWEELLRSRVYLDFGEQKARWHKECDSCDYLPYCSGDCLKQRLFHGRKHSRQLSWLCQGYKQFFQHALPGLENLADMIREERFKAGMQMAPRDLPGKRGRNEPCPCGSGLKYKKCCGG